MDTIQLDEIAPGATIRFTVIDGMQYLSIRDFIMHMCEKDQNDAGQIWRRMTPDKLSELQTSCLNFKFPGRGQQDQPVITFPGAIKLAMFLPGENAKRNRSVMSKILVRYFAGDRTLIQEIEANAQSEAPMAQMAKAAVAASLPNSADSQALESRKRVLDEEERAVAVDYRRAETKKLNSEAQRMDSETRMRQFELLSNVTERYVALCDPNMQMDERAKLLLKDSLLNFVVQPPAPSSSSSTGLNPLLAADEEGAKGSIPFVTISAVANDLGYKFTSMQLKTVGKRIAKAYVAKYGVPPTKHDQFVDGAVRMVNTYQTKDRPLVEAELHAAHGLLV